MRGQPEKVGFFCLILPHSKVRFVRAYHHRSKALQAFPEVRGLRRDDDPNPVQRNDHSEALSAETIFATVEQVLVPSSGKSRGSRVVSSRTNTVHIERPMRTFYLYSEIQSELKPLPSMLPLRGSFHSPRDRRRPKLSINTARDSSCRLDTYSISQLVTPWRERGRRPLLSACGGRRSTPALMVCRAPRPSGPMTDGARPPYQPRLSTRTLALRREIARGPDRIQQTPDNSKSPSFHTTISRSTGVRSRKRVALPCHMWISNSRSCGHRPLISLMNPRRVSQQTLSPLSKKCTGFD